MLAMSRVKTVTDSLYSLSTSIVAVEETKLAGTKGLRKEQLLLTPAYAAGAKEEPSSEH